MLMGAGFLFLLLGCAATVPGEPSQSIIPGLDSTGDSLGANPLVDLQRLETALTQSLDRSEGFQPELPAAVGGKMLAMAVEEQAVALEQLEIIASRPRQWRDGCLGIFSADELCIQAITPGWQGIVSDGTQEWVYHSDELGEVVKLNANASQTSARISLGALAQVGQLNGSVLSMQVSSRFTPDQPPVSKPYAMLIDGRLVELDANGLAQGQVQEISNGQLQAFDQQRNQARLEQFDGLRYGSSNPAEEYFRLSLVDSQGIVQYDSSAQAQLPPDLQTLNSAWETIICSGPLVNCLSSDLSPAAEAAE